MTENKKRAATRMVPAPSHGIIPERDFNERPVLEARNLGIDFGGLHAVEDFNLIIGKTEIAGLIGPNGAGKTTVFNLLTKVYQPTMGTIMLNGRDTAGMNTAQANKLGIARTFQNIRLFDNMSVEDNVRIGLHNQVRYGMISGIFRMPAYWRGEREMHERALDLLSIFDMQDLANHQAGSLPYGAQRRLEIVRALATNPSLLLLDEPAAGMNPHETEELMENITKIRDQFHIAILLIEHDMSLVMGICEGICVLNYGKIIAKGTAAEIQNNPVVIEAYLGKEEKGFYALVPSTKCSLLSFLERACVMDLDAFRAPLKTEDVARRGHLSLEERSNLYMWGYHRVLDSFQFHITLTDGIADAGLRALVGAGLRKALEGVLDAPLRIDALTLFKQENRNRPFSAVARLPFANVQTAQETA